MATFIVDTLNKIDLAIGSYAQTVFEGVGGPIQSVILAAGAVGFPLLAMNAVMQFQPMRMSQFTGWAMRYVVILSVATTWTQFLPIFTILTDVPNNYGASLLTAAGFATPTEGGLNAAMDQMVTNVLEVSDRLNEEAGVFTVSQGIAAFAVALLGSVMACVAILISAVGKIGLAMAVSLAPLAIASIMFNGTRQLFESWSRFTLGFAMIPLVLAGIMGAVIGIGTDLIVDSGSIGSIADAAGFLVVVLAAIFMMYQVPTMTSGLAGSIVAAAGAGLAAATASFGVRSLTGTARNAAGLGSRTAASFREAANAREQGGTTSQIAQAHVAGFRQSAFLREANREASRLAALRDNGGSTDSAQSSGSDNPIQQAAARNSAIQSQRASAAQSGGGSGNITPTDFAQRSGNN